MQQRDADGRPRAGRGAPVRRSAGASPADRAIPGGGLRPVLSHDEPPAGRRGRRAGDVRPRSAGDGWVSTRRGRSAPGCWRSPPIAAARHWPAGPAGRSWRWPSRLKIWPTPAPGWPTPTTWPASSSGPWPVSGPNIAWSSSCSTSRILSYDEIARAVTRPVGTVKTWLHRARAQLAEDLSRRGIERRGVERMENIVPRFRANVERADRRRTAALPDPGGRRRREP